MGFFQKVVNVVVSPVTDLLEDTVNNVGDLVDDTLGNVGKTVTQLLQDPKSLAILAMNVYLPGSGLLLGTSMGITNVMAAEFIGNMVINTALNGGDINAAAKSAAFQLGGTELAKTVSAGLADATISTATKQVIANTTSAAGIAIIQGKDPMAAIAAGGVAAGVNLITSQYAGFDKLPVASQKAINTTLKGALSGKDPTKELVYGAIGSGIQAYKNVSDGNDATKKELGRDLTEAEAQKLALYSSANTVGTDIKNLVVGEKSAKAIESGQSSYTYDNKPVAVSSTDLNNYFKGKLTDAGLTPTTADITAAATAYGKSKDAAGATNAVVDSRSVDAQEVKDIFAKEGITNPTADIISKYVKTNFDEATALADIQKQADAQYTTKQEVTDAFKGTGYTPTDADIAKFEGAKPEAMQLDTVRAYTQIVDAFKKEQTDPTKSTEIAKLAFQTVVDPRFMTRLPDGNVLIDTSNAPLINGLPELPAIQILLDKSDVDQLDYVPEFDETKYDVLQAIQKSNPNIKVDDLITGAMNAMKDQGYVPSIEELINIVNQPKDKTTVNVAKVASNYGDQKVINKDEAKQYLIDNGITKPTDAQINQFVKKGNEADIKKEIDAYANPLATTAAEAEQLLKAAGISKPTKEQIAMFTKEGLQTDTQKALSGYTNPLVTTAQEVKDMFAKIGYTNPTQEEIDRYTGEKPEAVQLDMAKTYGAAALATKQYVDPLNKRIEELVKQGSDYQTASNKAIAELTAANKGLSETLGTGKKAVTQADIDFMTQMVSGKAAGDSRYDVTGDKKVTQEDIDYLKKYIGGGADTFKPGAGTYWSPTGLYGKLYERDLVAESDKAAADKAAADKAAADKVAADKAAAIRLAATQKAALAKQGTQQSTDAFNQFSAQNKQMVQSTPTLADVYFYGKDFGTKRQKLTPEGELISPKPEEVAQGGVSGENDASSFLQQIMAQGDSASESDLRNIVGGGGYG